MSEIKQQVKIMCRSCKRKTIHTIKVSERYAWSEPFDSDNYEIIYWNDYQIVQCNGCEVFGFRIVATNSDERDYKTGDYIEEDWLYPDIQERRKPLTDNDKFPPKTKIIYFETLNAINSNLNILGAIGIRGLIESVCLEKNTQSYGLRDKIEELSTQGLISKDQSEFLHKLRFLGNQAAHEIIPPERNKLSHALDIVETMLKTIYILPNIANHL
jgi:hypothetical protein